MHAMDWLAALTLDKTGKSNAARIRMIPITDNNSIKVNARWDGASPFVTTMVLALVFMEFCSPFWSTGFRFYFLSTCLAGSYYTQRKGRIFQKAEKRLCFRPGSVA